MYFILSLALLLQVVATPLPTGGKLIVAEAEPQFPELPTESNPTPITQDLELLYVEVIPSSSGYQVRGEVRNISSSPLRSVTLLFTLANGTQFDGPTDFEYIAPGGRAPFSISVFGDDLVAALNQSQEFASVTTCGFEQIAPLQLHSWSFSDLELVFEASRRAVQVSGSATNVDGIPPEWSAPMLFSFSEDGHYAGDIYPVGDIAQFIPAGGTIEFDMNRGFGTFSTDDPFSNAGTNPTFVLAVVQPTQVSLSCA